MLKKKTSHLCFLQVNMQHFTVPLQPALNGIIARSLNHILAGCSPSARVHSRSSAPYISWMFIQKLYRTGSALLCLFFSGAETEVVLPGSCKWSRPAPISLL